MGPYYVYLWRNLETGKAYVGKGHGPRMRSHLFPSSDSLLALAIRKYGIALFECRVLCSDLEEPLALDLEKEMISRLGTRAPRGYNLTDGGEGVSGLVMSPESRERISRGKKGRVRAPRTLEHIRNHAAAIRGRPNPMGENHGLSKLTGDAVREIRSRYLEGGTSQRDLARLFNVCQAVIGRILRKQTWKHV